MLTHSVMLLRVKIGYASTCTLQPLLIKSAMPWSLPIPGVLFLGRLKALGTWEAVYRTWKWVPGPWCILVTTVHMIHSNSGNWVAQLSTPRGNLGSLALAPERLSSSLPTPLEIHTSFINCTPERPAKWAKIPKPGLAGIHYWCWIVAKETRAWSKKLGLATWTGLLGNAYPFL